MTGTAICSSVRQGGQRALKYDNLSFFKVILPQTMEPLGSANQYAPLVQHQRPCSMRDLLPKYAFGVLRGPPRGFADRSVPFITKFKLETSWQEMPWRTC